MPVCKNCGSRIEKFNKDICPICGCKNPLDGVSSDTVEVTSNITDLLENGKKPRFAKRKYFLILTFTCSFFGINFLYIKWVKPALLFLFANILIIGGLFSLLFFALNLHIALAIIIPLVLAFALDIIFSLFLFNNVFHHKDGKGTFVK